MLKRRSIKTKLVVVLALLLASVCVLAVGGWWGLNRYRQLAESVAHVTAEFGAANDLYRLAEMLRESNARIYEGHIRDGKSDADFFTHRTSRIEDATFGLTREDFERNLETYEDRVAEHRGDDPLLIDAGRRKVHLREIRESFEELESVLDRVSKPDSYATRLRDALERLVQETQTYAETLGSGMGEFRAEVRASHRTWNAITWFCAILAVVLVGLLLWSFWTLLVQPFRTLLDGSRLVAGGEFGHRIYLETGDELNELADAMNAMSEKFQLAYGHLDSLRRNLQQQVEDRTREVIRNEQLASVGFLAAGVAHEINNPLTSIAWAAESLEAQMADLEETDASCVNAEAAAALQTTLRQVQEEAFRCKGITDRLLDFSRMSDVRREPTDVGRLVEDVVELVSKVGEFRCKTIRTHRDDTVIAQVNSHQIRQVVLNLLTNALESVDSQGSVDVYVRSDSESARVTVVDTGCGMTDEVMRHLFEPFFTRRRDGTGTGLGLSITYRIVSQHGGSLVPHSDGVGRGSRMELRLPLQPESDADNRPPESDTAWTHDSYQAA